MRSLLVIVWLLAICLAIFETPLTIAESAETALDYSTRLLHTWANLMLTNNDVSGKRTTTVPNVSTKEPKPQVIRLGRIIRSNVY